MGAVDHGSRPISGAPCLLHFSDPHFGTEVPEVVAALTELAHALQPEAVVLSGDVTQRATPAQFHRAKAFMDGLPDAPQLVIPGNHDIPLCHLPLRLLAPYRRMKKDFPDVLAPRLTTAHFAVAGVRTTRRWRHKHGQVSRSDAQAAADWLAHNAQGPVAARLRIVAAHHPVALPPGDRAKAAGEAKNLLRGREIALPIWQQAGVQVVVGGHIHWPFVRAIASEGAASGTGTASLWAVSAATAVSARVRHQFGHSVNVLRWVAPATTGAAPGAEVERWDYVPAAGAFLPMGRQALSHAAQPAETAHASVH